MFLTVCVREMKSNRGSDTPLGHCHLSCVLAASVRIRQRVGDTMRRTPKKRLLGVDTDALADFNLELHAFRYWIPVFFLGMHKTTDMEDISTQQCQCNNNSIADYFIAETRSHTRSDTTKYFGNCLDLLVASNL